MPVLDPSKAPPAALRGSLAGRQGCGGKSNPHTPARGFLVRAGSRVRFARASVRRGGGALPRRAGGAAPDLSTFRADHRPAQSRGNVLPWCWVGDKRSASERRAAGESAGGEGAGRYTSHILPCLSLGLPLSGVHPLCRCSPLACHSSDAGAHANGVCVSAPLPCFGWGAASLQKLEGALSCFSETRGARSRANSEVRTYGLLRKPSAPTPEANSKGALIRRCATCAPRPSVGVKKRACRPWVRGGIGGLPIAS